MDQSVDQPNNGLPYNAVCTTVESGSLNHCIVQMMPMIPKQIDTEHLNGLNLSDYFYWAPAQSQGLDLLGVTPWRASHPGFGILYLGRLRPPR
eukprot:10350958-Ditylum_brightwellii.AAC.1